MHKYKLVVIPRLGVTLISLKEKPTDILTGNDDGPNINYSYGLAMERGC